MFYSSESLLSHSYLSTLSASLQNGMLALSIVLSLASLGFHTLIYIYRTEKIIVNSSMEFCQVVLYIGNTRPLAQLLKYTYVLCYLTRSLFLVRFLPTLLLGLGRIAI